MSLLQNCVSISVGWHAEQNWTFFVFDSGFLTVFDIS